MTLGAFLVTATRCLVSSSSGCTPGSIRCTGSRSPLKGKNQSHESRLKNVGKMVDSKYDNTKPTLQRALILTTPVIPSQRKARCSSSVFVLFEKFPAMTSVSQKRGKTCLVKPSTALRSVESLVQDCSVFVEAKGAEETRQEREISPLLHPPPKVKDLIRNLQACRR